MPIKILIWNEYTDIILLPTGTVFTKSELSPILAFIVSTVYCVGHYRMTFVMNIGGTDNTGIVC